jgi:hypothetical protein
MDVEYHVHVGRRWEIRRVDGDLEWPDMVKQYAEMTYRPRRLVFTANFRDDKEPEFGTASISGPRINKGGREGAVISDTFYYTDDLPEWAQKLVKGLMAVSQ